MKKYLRFSEYVWAVITILCIGVTVFYFAVGNSDNGVFGMIMTAVAGLMYSLRRRFNRHVERAEKQQPPRQG
ncbi:MAG TPA: hypothetical protein VI731_03015 [Bacteroidia bacterium]|nr:hypothetical protein [Bacteroidia bacterium]